MALFLITLFVGLFANGQNYSAISANIIEDANLPGLQLSYINNGKEVNYAAGAGDKYGGKPVTSSTIFRAGTLGKCRFTYAVMKLFCRGVISPDTSLLNYMGTYNRFDPAISGFKKITARMVLSYTSGLSELEPIQKVKASLLFEPGSSFLYSCEGIWFLQKVVENLINKPFEQIILEEVFKPLSMRYSTYVQTEAMDKAMLGSQPKSFAWLSPNAAFILITSPEDYCRFLTALLAGKD